MPNLNLNGKAPDTAERRSGDLRHSPMQLIGCIGRLMSERIRSTDENPIRQKSGRLLLMEIANKEGRTQLDLVHATHLKAPTISVALQKLEKEGFVSRRPDEYDLRATRVFLTEKGRALDDKVRQRVREEEREATEGLTEAECETLVRLLTKIKNNLIDDSEKDGELY